MRWNVSVLYVGGLEEVFSVDLSDGYPLAQDLGNNLTADRNDILKCTDGSIVALPVGNILRLKYTPAVPPPPFPALVLE